jgi:hypothetical protein
VRENLLIFRRPHHQQRLYRNIAWAAIIFGISGLINSHPLRSKNSAGGPMSSFLWVSTTPVVVSSPILGAFHSMCITAFVALYFPLFFITKPITT